MYCSNCAAELSTGAKFCSNCAFPASGGASVPAQTIIVQPEKKKMVSFFGLFEALCAVVLLGLLVLGGLYYYRKYQNDNKPSIQVNIDKL